MSCLCPSPFAVFGVVIPRHLWEVLLGSEPQMLRHGLGCFGSVFMMLCVFIGGSSVGIYVLDVSSVTFLVSKGALCGNLFPKRLDHNMYVVCCLFSIQVWVSYFRGFFECCFSLTMAEQADGQPPAIKRRRITNKRSDPNYEAQLQIQEDPDEQWCAIGPEEDEECLNFFDAEVRCGTLKRLSKHKDEDIRAKKKKLHTQRSRKWKSCCALQTATVGDKSWRISGHQSGAMEEHVFRMRYFLDAAKSADLTSIERGVAILLLRDFLLQQDDGEQQRVDKELVKGCPTLLSYNDNWTLSPKIGNRQF